MAAHDSPVRVPVTGRGAPGAAVLLEQGMRNDCPVATSVYLLGPALGCEVDGAIRFTMGAILLPIGGVHIASGVPMLAVGTLPRPDGDVAPPPKPNVGFTASATSLRLDF